jgi:hypothetical protein
MKIPGMEKLFPLLGMILALLLGGPAGADFVRGDANIDGSLTITDPIVSIRSLFQEAGESLVYLDCQDAGDSNDDGQLDLSDPIYLLRYLFLAGPPLPAPFPRCGPDPTDDSLSCEGTPTLLCESVLEVFVVDRSSSMGEGTKPEKVRIAFRQARPYPGMAAGFIFFDDEATVLPADGRPLWVTEDLLAQATAAIGDIGARGSCAGQALLDALSMADRWFGSQRWIVFISDGLTDGCPGWPDAVSYRAAILDAVRARNTGGVRIMAICTGPSDEVEAGWMEEMAKASHGTFIRFE